ncbi:MAG: FAD-binding oxidoreductase [SAR86 cluster bacterium]|nr:FAD-binding oxidoreductase [SAR86 cluster bacterium]
MSKLSGWGRASQYSTKVTTLDINNVSEQSKTTSIARGLGRSYGDSSINRELVLSTKKLDKVISFDKEKGIIKVESGLSLKALLEVIIPTGWFIPVSPGTKYVTIGGMVAADVHGKNHHCEGSFGNHIDELVIVNNGKKITCSEEKNHNFFWNTIGGMGLTGIIYSVKFRLKRIYSDKIIQSTVKTKNLKETLEVFQNNPHSAYSVGWMDLSANGKEKGRAIVFFGEHATKSTNLSSFRFPKFKIKIPFIFPSYIMNKLLIDLFNRFYFLFTSIFPKKIIGLDKFFYPLDSILDWPKLYGYRGFFQYQAVFPMASSYFAINEILDCLKKEKVSSAVSVIKLFGEENASLSFPRKGFTVCFDIQCNRDTERLYGLLMDITKKYEGGIYLAKDQFCKKESMPDRARYEEKLTNIKNSMNQMLYSSEQSDRLK